MNHPESLHTVAIVQARMASSRLPGKVLVDIGGQPMLVRVVERARRARLLHEVVVATTLDQSDDRVADLCHERGYSFSRGHPTDVLDRYVRAAKAHGAQVIVRITGDCPLIEPDVIDEVVEAFRDAKGEADYASNRIDRRVPVGLDVEVMSLTALSEAAHTANETHQREHVTPYFYENPDRFGVISISAGQDYSHLRWTVDTEEDLAFVREVYRRFGGRDDFSWREVLDLIRREPELPEINAHVRQKDYREVG